MTPEHLAQLLRGGEGLTVEFKRAREALNRDVYETICAFLNQRGGTLVLGAAEVGKAISVAAIYTDQMGASEGVASSATAARASVIS